MEHMDIYSSNFLTFKMKERKSATCCVDHESPQLKEDIEPKNNQTECRERSRTGLQQLAGLCDNLRGLLCLTSDGTLRELAELDGVR